MELFVIIVNGFQPLAIVTKRSMLNVAAALDRLCWRCLICNERYEAVVHRNSNENIVLKFLQNSQEKRCAEITFSMQL